MSAEVIYTASDLDRKRREVTDVARRGVARIRDTDGMGLVLLSARHYEVLDAVSRWHDRLDVAERALAKPSSGRVPRDFGDLTWLRHFDDDDLATFISEVRAAVSVAYHDDDLTELDQLVRDAPGPVLADEYMGLIPLQGHPLYFQPVEFSWLVATGKWDTTPLVAAIQRREFSAVFLYESSSSGPTIISRWPRAVLDAIYANYQVKTNMLDVWIYVPQPDTIWRFPVLL